jgi:hypothetical protein
MRVNNVEITKETIVKTRQHFIDIHRACIADAISGKTRVNDLRRYIHSEDDRIFALEEGLSDYSLTFVQAALWIQTGGCVGIIA